MLETDANGWETARNVYGTNLISRTVTLTVNGTTQIDQYNYMYNGHGDVTALLKADGTIIASYYYDAFGTVIEKNEPAKLNNPYRYAGYIFDSETNLYYLNARYYDSKIARFMSEDTYRGQANDPLSLNLYTYCHNEPVMYSDPSGHSEIVRQIRKGIRAFLDAIHSAGSGSSSGSGSGSSSGSSSGSGSGSSSSSIISPMYNSIIRHSYRDLVNSIFASVSKIDSPTDSAHKPTNLATSDYDFNKLLANVGPDTKLKDGKIAIDYKVEYTAYNTSSTTSQKVIKVMILNDSDGIFNNASDFRDFGLNQKHEGFLGKAELTPDDVKTFFDSDDKKSEVIKNDITAILKDKNGKFVERKISEDQTFDRYI